MSYEIIPEDVSDLMRLITTTIHLTLAEARACGHTVGIGRTNDNENTALSTQCIKIIILCRELTAAPIIVAFYVIDAIFLQPTGNTSGP